MNLMTEISIDVAFCRDETDTRRARFDCNPRLKSTEEDEISVTIMEGDKELHIVTLTTEQCGEFVWALQKMVQIAKEYEDVGPRRKRRRQTREKTSCGD